MPKKMMYAIFAICALGISIPQLLCAQQIYAVIARHDAPMKTRDGVTLYADIYRPKDEGKFPVILMRKIGRAHV